MVGILEVSLYGRSERDGWRCVWGSVCVSVEEVLWVAN